MSMSVVLRSFIKFLRYEGLKLTEIVRRLSKEIKEALAQGILHKKFVNGSDQLEN